MADTQRVLFEDKVKFQTSELPEINKATDANYNELKDVTNFNAQAFDDRFILVTGDVSAIQNLVTSDITAQTTGAGDPTFTGKDWTIDVTGRTSTGEVNFLDFKKTDGGTTDVFKVDIDGNITASSAISAFMIFGNVRIDSRAGNLAYFSHFAMSGDLQYAVRENSVGATFINAATGQSLSLAINGSPQWVIDPSGNLTGSTGNTFTVDGKLTANDRLALGLTTGDVASPLEAEFWYNDTLEKFRAEEGGVVKNVIGSAVEVEAVEAVLTSLVSANSDGSNMRYLELVFFSVEDASIIAQAVDLITLANSELVNVDLEVSMIEDDGNAGGSFKVESTWQKDSGGTFAQIGTDTTIHSQEDLSSTPTIVFTDNSGTLRVTIDSGSAGVGMAFCLKAKLLVSAIA